MKSEMQTRIRARAKRAGGWRALLGRARGGQSDSGWKDYVKACHDNMESTPDWEDDQGEFRDWQSAKFERMSRNWRVIYSAYLASIEWDSKRAARLARNRKRNRSPQCEYCGKTHYMDDGKHPLVLQVHHESYHRAGDEWMEDLAVICRSCHEGQHPDSAPRRYAPEERARFLEDVGWVRTGPKTWRFRKYK